MYMTPRKGDLKTLGKKNAPPAGSAFFMISTVSMDGRWYVPIALSTERLQLLSSPQVRSNSRPEGPDSPDAKQQ